MTLEEATKYLEKTMVTNPGINLESGENCFLAEEATAVISKNQNIGTTHNSAGGGIYYRGISLHENSGTRKIVRGTVTDKYPGHLYLTSKRVLMVAYKGGFDIPWTKLVGFEAYSDGLMLTSGGKSYLVETNSVKKIKKFVEANNVYVQSQQKPNEVSSASKAAKPSSLTTDDVSELRKYKELLDEGIITQEEFDDKKKAVLQGNTVAEMQTEARVNIQSVVSEDGSVTKRPTGKKSAILWIGFLIMLGLTALCIKPPAQVRLIPVFGFLALGFLLHIDPANVRKRISPAVTWIICTAVALAGGLLLK